MDTWFIIVFPLERDLWRNIDFLYAVAILAAILDFEYNQKQGTGQFPPRQNVIHTPVTIKKCKSIIVTKHCKVPWLCHWTEFRDCYSAHHIAGERQHILSVALPSIPILGKTWHYLN